MQGVEQFGEFAIQMRLKMMTKPGEQFVIRRRAYAMIKKAFAANGIENRPPDCPGRRRGRAKRCGRAKRAGGGTAAGDECLNHRCQAQALQPSVRPRMSAPG
jgi:hypothetical protein